MDEILLDSRRYDLRATRATATSIALTWREVTQRFEAAQRLAASENNYRLMAENSTDVVVHVRDGRFVWVSPSVDSLFGAPADYWVGRDVREIFPRADLAAWAARVKTVTMGGVVRERYQVSSMDGVLHWVDAHSKPFYDEDGRQDGSIATLRLIDDQVAAEKALEEARRLQARAAELYHRAVDHAAIAMCLVAPDGRWREVNDAACRLFGYDAETLKQKTWQDLTPPEYLDKSSQNVTDLHEGRLRERLEFEEAMSRAITEGRLVVYAQPIVDAHTGRVVEEELLVRLVEPDGNVLVPAEFLPQAQRFGMMSRVDRFMVARGLELARAGRHVAVNLSADSINDRATVVAIIDELRQAGDAASRVSFEITETTALASTEVANRFSSDMRLLGCRLALDDFGTGFGTFTDLRAMALHKLKIDRSFVSGLLSNTQDESVVKAIVGIAREFGLVTIAEGVEDTDTQTRLVELGVDQLQGYLIGVPAPATTTTAGAYN